MVCSTTLVKTLSKYPYTIIVQDEDCLDATIEKESVAQETSEAVSLSEAQEVVKIPATSTPDCAKPKMVTTPAVKQSQDGSVCGRTSNMQDRIFWTQAVHSIL